MDRRLYGRITYRIQCDDFVLEVFNFSGPEATYTNGKSYHTVEEYFHFKYPTGYIIPDWLGV